MCCRLYKPGDSIVVVMVTSKDGTEEAKVVEQYRSYLGEAKVRATHRTYCAPMRQHWEACKRLTVLSRASDQSHMRPHTD